MVPGVLDRRISRVHVGLAAATKYIPPVTRLSNPWGTAAVHLENLYIYNCRVAQPWCASQLSLGRGLCA